MELLRGAVGDPKLTYLGFSYGTFLGATYATLFPGKMRAVVLDGPVDAEQYINDPMQGLREQTAGFERALGRFFQACAADQVNCSGFGGSDPWGTFDELVEKADASPIPAPGYAPDPRPIKGDDLLSAAVVHMYAKQAWGDLALALSEAAHNDGSRIRRMVDEDVYGRDPETGEYDPASDRYFMLSAIEQRYRKGDVDFYLEAGDACWGQFDHFWSTAATSSSTTACGRSGRAMCSGGRSGSRTRPRRRWSSTRRMTPRPRIAAAYASSATSATRGC